MLKFLQRLAVLAAAACAPAAYAANATLVCAGTWGWDSNTATLTCQTTAPEGPPTCSNISPSTTTPGASGLVLTATCAANGGTINRWEFAGPDSNTNFIGQSGNNTSPSTTAPAEGAHTFYVRASKDGGTTWGDWYSKSITFSAAVTTPPSGCSITPTSATTGQARTFSVSCSNVLGGATYQWTSTGGSPSSGTGSSHTVTYSPAGNYSLTVQVCNAVSACATATQTVQVGDAVLGGCTNLSGITTTMYFPPGGQVWDLQPGNVKWWTSEQGSFTGKHAALVAFRTPADASPRIGSIAIAEIGSNPTNRLMLLSETRCATTSNYLIGAYGSTATVNFTVGTPVSGVTTLQPNTVYYVTITNRSRSGLSYVDSCGTKDCSAIIELKL